MKKMMLPLLLATALGCAAKRSQFQEVGDDRRVVVEAVFEGPTEWHRLKICVHPDGHRNATEWDSHVLAWEWGNITEEKTDL